MNKEENPFLLNGSEEKYTNPWMRVREDRVTRPDGKSGIFGVVEMRPGVTVVALTPEKEIILAKEYKYAVGRHTLECISGGIDDGESVLEAAKRELKEEVGAESDTWVDLGSLDPFTTVISSPNHMFLVKNARITGVLNADGGEVIKMIRVPFEEALAKARAGEITHGASVAGILKAYFILGEEGGDFG